MKKMYILLFGLGSFLTSGIHAQNTITVKATKDASLYGCVPCGYSVQNFGSDPDLSAIAWTNSGSPSNCRGLFDFDLSAIPNNATIVDAKLFLYHNPTSGNGGHSSQSGSNACLLQRVTQSWSEDAVTWNTQPTSTSTNEVLLAPSAGASDDYVNIGVKNMVIDMKNNQTQSFGMILKLQDENFFRKLVFASSDHIDSTRHPKLEVTYLTAVGLNTVEKMNSSVSISPNPFTYQTTLTSTVALENTTVTVVNTVGQTVQELTGVSGYSVNLVRSQLPAGIYFVSLTQDSRVLTTRKFIIAD